MEVGEGVGVVVGGVGGGWMEGGRGRVVTALGQAEK